MIRSMWRFERASVFAASIGLTLGPSARAQSFNIDIDVDIGFGSGVPNFLFPGAAMQSQVWTDIPTDGAGPFALKDLQGNDTSVMLTRSGSFSGFSFNYITVILNHWLDACV